MGLTNIQWCDFTFNAWLGCRKVAPECENCYITSTPPFRFRKLTHGKDRVRTAASTWKQPIAWNRTAAKAIGIYDPFTNSTAERPRVFCLSLGDWLDNEVPIEWLADLLKLIHDTPNLDWLLLTKRPENWIERANACMNYWDSRGEIAIGSWLSWWLDTGGNAVAPANIWIGVSQGADQAAALEIPAVVHFLSCEPMLKPLDTTYAARFDWVIFGGESGKKARSCDLDWFRCGLQFCRANNVAPFVKQLGAFCIDGMRMQLKDSHGGDMSEWPEDFRVREFPRLQPEGSAK